MRSPQTYHSARHVPTSAHASFDRCDFEEVGCQEEAWRIRSCADLPQFSGQVLAPWTCWHDTLLHVPEPCGSLTPSAAHAVTLDKAGTPSKQVVLESTGCMGKGMTDPGMAT
ncbi:hypothetical protein Bbelb_405050 [Branchiostoma belcheri]|nr:hypothetical protein Bbelb_405050 [Branchiostoma belcheri]